ncbi:monocarboxylate transporter 13-like [Gigantopelta aegis]|uniref:monocarboxylate transporter 13-like n=1 Tax=Gigantopelta aegis TaxID=1735272 RepID=UPI001B88AD25|nr:monocarboxylate transporter 13-like [Gigantopelta aegis]
MHAANGAVGYVVIISSFLIQVIAFGVCSSIGIYNMEYLDYFTNDAVAVSFVAAINIGCFQLTGPLVSFLMTVLEYRTIVLIGSLLSFIGLIVIPWLPTLEYLYIFQGALTGIGYCFVFVASQVLSSLYFDKGRSLAAGIVTSGSGFGTAVFPILVGYLVEFYSWKGSIYIVAGISLNLLVLGGLLRPLPEAAKNRIVAEETVIALTTKTRKKPLKNFRVLTDFCFDVLFINNICYNMCACILIAFGPEYFTTIGLSKIDAAFQLTLSGLATFLGALVGGVLGNINCLNRFGMYMVSNIFEGLAAGLFPLVSGLDAITTLSVTFGFCFGVCLGLLVMVTIDVLGPESIGDGLGYLMLANGFGAFLGPILAGYLKQKTGSYRSSFYLAGGVSISGGVIILLILLKTLLAKRHDAAHSSDVPGEFSFIGKENEGYVADVDTEKRKEKTQFHDANDLSGKREHKVEQYDNEKQELSSKREQKKQHYNNEICHLSGKERQKDEHYDNEQQELSNKREQQKENDNNEEKEVSGEREQKESNCDNEGYKLSDKRGHDGVNYYDNDEYKINGKKEPDDQHYGEGCELPYERVQENQHYYVNEINGLSDQREQKVCVCEDLKGVSKENQTHFKVTLEPHSVDLMDEAIECTHL